jgi:nucleotide-binding universal stress UspA family protein
MYSHKRVLVTLDGSPAAEAVLGFLLDIAGPLDMRIVLLRVLEPVPPVVIEGTRHMELEDVTGRMRGAEEYLAPIAAALRAKGVEVACQVRRGRPVDEILAAAREGQADLIAMATHGRTGLGRLFFGSVAEEVLRHAPVPVFMIRQPAALHSAAATEEAGAR